MNKILITLALTIITGALAYAGTTEPDSMYIHFTGANGDSIVEHAIADIDSIVYYPPARSGIFTDSRDSKNYKWVTIGNQVWMAENLAYLPRVHSNALFTNADSACFGVYNYDGNVVIDAKNHANYTTYGVLYNWYAAMNGSTSSYTIPSNVQGVCPSGWHLPSNAEWVALSDALTEENRSSQLAGKTDLWSNGTLKYATSDFGTSGFSALPGGYRFSLSGVFYDQGEGGYWWSSTQFNSGSACHMALYYDESIVYHYDYFKSSGFSVRCIRD